MPAPEALTLIELLLLLMKLQPVMSALLAPEVTMLLVLDTKLLPVNRRLPPPVTATPVSMTLNNELSTETKAVEPVITMPVFAGVLPTTDPLNAEFLKITRILFIVSPVVLLKNCTPSNKMIGTPAALLIEIPV